MAVVSLNKIRSEAPEEVFVDSVGQYIFKIVDFVSNGFDKNGNTKYKISLKGFKGSDRSKTFIKDDYIIRNYYGLPKWENLYAALKAPETCDTDDFINRYIIANIVEGGEGLRQNGTPYKKFEISDYLYSNLNDKLEPIKEAKEEDNTDDFVPSSTRKEFPVIEISDDEIPF